MSTEYKSQRFKKLRQQLSSASNEEEVRLAWVRALEATLGIAFNAERGKRDLSYNNVVIEFKGPGKFNGKTASTAFQEAVHKRLLPYILQTAEEERIDESDYIGIAIDDKHLAFAQVVDGKITHRNILPITERTFGMVVEACRLCYRRAITASNLIEDFGHESSCGIALMRAMAEALAEAARHRSGEKIRMLFEEWRTLYGQVADLSSEQLKDINGTLRFARASTRTDVPARLFVVHTYNSLLSKLLAAEIVTGHGLASGGTFAGDLVAIEDDSELLRRLRADIEEGGFFEATGIHGFVEEAIFSWYLDAATNKSHRSAIGTAIRDVLTELSLLPHGQAGSFARCPAGLRPEGTSCPSCFLRRSESPRRLSGCSSLRALGLTCSSWTGTRVLDPTCANWLVARCRNPTVETRGGGRFQ